MSSPPDPQYLGVFWNGTQRMWEATVDIDDEPVLLGFFRSEARAAEAYDRAVRAHYGDDAPTNFQKNRVELGQSYC